MDDAREAAILNISIRTAQFEMSCNEHHEVRDGNGGLNPSWFAWMQDILHFRDELDRAYANCEALDTIRTPEVVAACNAYVAIRAGYRRHRTTIMDWFSHKNQPFQEFFPPVNVDEMEDALIVEVDTDHDNPEIIPAAPVTEEIEMQEIPGVIGYGELVIAGSPANHEFHNQLLLDSFEDASVTPFRNVVDCGSSGVDCGDAHNLEHDTNKILHDPPCAYCGRKELRCEGAPGMRCDVCKVKRSEPCEFANRGRTDGGGGTGSKVQHPAQHSRHKSTKKRNVFSAPPPADDDGLKSKARTRPRNPKRSKRKLPPQSEAEETAPRRRKRKRETLILDTNTPPPSDAESVIICQNRRPSAVGNSGGRKGD